MPRFLVFLVVSSALVLGQASPSTKTKSSRTGATAKPAPAPTAKVELPADAEKVRDGVWRHKDKEGKVWIYTSTPFGLNKEKEEVAAAATKTSEPSTLRLVSRKDDTYIFERPTPFGSGRWTRKSSELTDEEKKLVDAAAAPVTVAKE